MTRVVFAKSFCCSYSGKLLIHTVFNHIIRLYFEGRNLFCLNCTVFFIVQLLNTFSSFIVSLHNKKPRHLAQQSNRPKKKYYLYILSWCQSACAPECFRLRHTAWGAHGLPPRLIKIQRSSSPTKSKSHQRGGILGVKMLRDTAEGGLRRHSVTLGESTAKSSDLALTLASEAS